MPFSLLLSVGQLDAASAAAWLPVSRLFQKAVLHVQFSCPVSVRLALGSDSALVAEPVEVPSLDGRSRKGVSGRVAGGHPLPRPARALQTNGFRSPEARRTAGHLGGPLLKALLRQRATPDGPCPQRSYGAAGHPAWLGDDGGSTSYVLAARSAIRCTSAGGAVSGEPASKGGSGAYSMESWIA